MKRVFLLMLLIFGLMPAKAQEPEPIGNMLVHLPKVTEDNPIIVYADIELALSAWLNVPEVNSIEDYEALSEEEREVYILSLPMVLPPFMRLVLYSDRVDNFSESYGIDYFSIDRVMGLFNQSFHTPFFALIGDFDEEAIIDRRLEAGYGQHGDDDWIVLCPEADCESDFMPNNDEFLSGGFIVRDNLFINAMSPEYLREIEEIMYGAAAARLDVPEYFAPRRLLLNSGDISQLIYIEPEVTEFHEPMGEDVSAVEVLPPYGLVTFAELVFAEEASTEVHIILSYENAEDAEIAAENIEANLNNPDVFNLSLFESLDGEIESIGVSQEPLSDLFLLQVILSSPFQQDGSQVSSSSMFRLIYSSSLLFAWQAD
jgi:hypothetical protein